MANQRPTKRERREEAKRRRLEEARRRQRRARTRKLYTTVIVGIVIAGIVGLVLWQRSRSEAKREASATTAAAAGCDPVKEFDDEGARHVPPTQTVNYKTNPPTSGNHYDATAQTGIHPSPVPNGNQVHNLEHGHIVIQYKEGLDQALLTGLEDLVQSDRTALILAPRPDMPFQLAFTSWGRLQGCNTPTAKAVDAAKDFAGRFKGKSPEGFKQGQPLG